MRVNQIVCEEGVTRTTCPHVSIDEIFRFLLFARNRGSDRVKLGQRASYAALIYISSYIWGAETLKNAERERESLSPAFLENVRMF